MRNTYLATGIIVVVLVVLAFMIVRGRLPQIGQKATPSPSPTVQVQDAVSASKHTAAKTAVVDSVTLTKPGFVTIHEETGGQPGTIIGVSDFLEAGTHENVTVSLTRRTVAGEKLFAQVYSDNGNGAFESNQDQLVTDRSGGVVMVQFEVASEGGSGFQIPATGLGE